MTTAVLVAGGGPSGCVTAHKLRQAGYSVVLVHHDTGGPPARGETLPPRGVSLLRRLEIGTDLPTSARLNNATVTSAWGTSIISTTDYSFHPFGPWWHVDRAAFDRNLQMNASRSGAIIISGRVARAWSEIDYGSRWVVEVHSKGEVWTYRTGFLVDATGRTSMIARRLGATHHRLDKLVSLVGVFEDTPRSEPTLMTESAECGWWYSISMPDGKLAVALNSDSDLIPHQRRERQLFWQHAMTRSPHTFARSLACRSKASAVVVSTAYTARLRCAAGRGWIAVGDACASHDPLSSNGLCHALESGQLAALAVAADFSGDETALPRYASAIEGNFSRYMQHRWLQYYREQRWPNSVFWGRRNFQSPSERTISELTPA